MFTLADDWISLSSSLLEVTTGITHRGCSLFPCQSQTNNKSQRYHAHFYVFHTYCVHSNYRSSWNYLFRQPSYSKCKQQQKSPQLITSERGVTRIYFYTSVTSLGCVFKTFFLNPLVLLTPWASARQDCHSISSGSDGSGDTLWRSQCNLHGAACAAQWSGSKLEFSVLPEEMWKWWMQGLKLLTTGGWPLHQRTRLLSYNHPENQGTWRACQPVKMLHAI